MKLIRICNLLKEEGQTIQYEYDPGDDWQMTIKLQSIIWDEQRTYRRPVCMDGENSAPPEDVGGFEDFMEIISDPQHLKYRSYQTWAGRSYDPKNLT